MCISDRSFLEIRITFYNLDMLHWVINMSETKAELQIKPKRHQETVLKRAEGSPCGACGSVIDCISAHYYCMQHDSTVTIS